MRQLEGLWVPASPKTNIIPFSGVIDIANATPDNDDDDDGLKGGYFMLFCCTHFCVEKI